MTSATPAIEATERAAFEEACYQEYLAERQKRAIPDDLARASSKADLMWRRTDGKYGVAIFNAAWWAWETRAAR